MKNSINENLPLVSICTVTYNHEKFIAEAIEGVLMQKGKFNIEMIIGEDCSTDNTRAIVKSYAEKYPDIIKPIFHEMNVGPANNSIACLNACKGKYIAALEGDDYWTDPGKLQKQVNLMEKNPDLALTFHKVVVWSQEQNKQLYVSNEDIEKDLFDTTDLIEHDWFIKTNSIVFRKSAFRLPDWFKNVVNGDYALQLLCSLNGKAKFINETMGVYRKHTSGVSVNFLTMEKGCHTLSQMLDSFNEYTSYKFNKEIKRKKIKLRTRLIEEFAYDIPQRNFFERKYWENYFKILKYSDLKNVMHWKYLVRFALPVKPKL